MTQTDYIRLRDKALECIKEKKGLCFKGAQDLMEDNNRWFAFLEEACGLETEVEMIALCLKHSSSVEDALYITAFLFRMIDIYKAEKFHRIMMKQKETHV